MFWSFNCIINECKEQDLWRIYMYMAAREHRRKQRHRSLYIRIMGENHGWIEDRWQLKNSNVCDGIFNSRIFGVQNQGASNNTKGSNAPKRPQTAGGSSVCFFLTEQVIMSSKLSKGVISFSILDEIFSFTSKEYKSQVSFHTKSMDRQCQWMHTSHSSPLFRAILMSLIFSAFFLRGQSPQSPFPHLLCCEPSKIDESDYE